MSTDSAGENLTALVASCSWSFSAVEDMSSPKKTKVIVVYDLYTIVGDQLYIYKVYYIVPAVL